MLFIPAFSTTKKSYLKLNFMYKSTIYVSIYDCNWTRTQNHLVLKRTNGLFGQMVECSFKN